MMSCARALVVAATLVGAWVAPLLIAAPANAENVVRWVTAAGVADWDPHTTDRNDTWNGRDQVFEGLTYNDANFSLHPALASSWRLVRPDTWRFELRPGVTFHDGSPFTAKDVAFSLARARARTSEFTSYADVISAVATLDEHTVEITTKKPDLRLPVLIGVLVVTSQAWAEQHDAELPARPGDRPAYTFAHVNGTGPFMLESAGPDAGAVLVRNPAWWGLATWPHTIDRIVWSAEPDPARRLALLLNGETDLLQDPPLDQLGRLQAASGVWPARTSALRTWFFGMNQGSAELHTSDVKGKNPFADKRVRQALYQAIDVEALIGKTLGGLGVPAGIIAAPGMNGYDPELDVRLRHDPDQAKMLLADAGWYLGATGYANPAVDALLEQIDGELSTPVRDALIEQAWPTALGDVAMIPLYRPQVVWAVHDTLELPVTAVNIPKFRQAQVVEMKR